MGDGGIKDTLWANVRALMLARYGRENINRLARDAKIGPASVQRIKDAETSVGIDVIEKIAKWGKLEPWQLLAPGMNDDKFLEVIALWNETNGRGRRMLLGAVRGATHEEDADAERVSPRKTQR